MTPCAIDATGRLPQYRVPVSNPRDVSRSETESDELASGRVSFVAGRRIESWEQKTQNGVLAATVTVSVPVGLPQYAHDCRRGGYNTRVLTALPAGKHYILY